MRGFQGVWAGQKRSRPDVLVPRGGVQASRGPSTRCERWLEGRWDAQVSGVLRAEASGRGRGGQRRAAERAGGAGCGAVGPNPCLGGRRLLTGRPLCSPPLSVVSPFIQAGNLTHVRKPVSPRRPVTEPWDYGPGSLGCPSPSAFCLLFCIMVSGNSNAPPHHSGQALSSPPPARQPGPPDTQPRLHPPSLPFGCQALRSSQPHAPLGLGTCCSLVRAQLCPPHCPPCVCPASSSRSDTVSCGKMSWRL